jgi:phosphoribosylanthranilate isomerase
MGLRVKICGITRPEQGQAIAALGATALGFICVPASPRYVTPDQIARIVDQLAGPPATGKPGCDRIGVFMNASLEAIQATVAIAPLSGIQLHGNESPEFCHRLRQLFPATELIKALRIKTSDDLQQVDLYQDGVDTFLLDAYHPTLAGGTGTTLDWTGLQEFQPGRPWFLAGGLTPDNVLQALQQLRPDGIDLSSGVEHGPGNKDMEKVKALFRQLRQLEALHDQ